MTIYRPQIFVRLAISIHTPARGVTMSLVLLFMVFCKISIHTPARGVTEVTSFFCVFSIYFNPHSRKGSDYLHTAKKRRKNHFNPHSRKGSDIKVSFQCINVSRISIHTPARGVTGDIETLQSGVTISIHTPARGVTLLSAVLYFNRWRFQSTLPQGE